MFGGKVVNGKRVYHIDNSEGWFVLGSLVGIFYGLMLFIYIGSKVDNFLLAFLITGAIVGFILFVGGGFFVGIKEAVDKSHSEREKLK